MSILRGSLGCAGPSCEHPDEPLAAGRRQRRHRGREPDSDAAADRAQVQAQHGRRGGAREAPAGGRRGEDFSRRGKYEDRTGCARPPTLSMFGLAVMRPMMALLVTLMAQRAET